MFCFSSKEKFLSGRGSVGGNARTPQRAKWKVRRDRWTSFSRLLLSQRRHSSGPRSVGRQCSYASEGQMDKTRRDRWTSFSRLLLSQSYSRPGGPPAEMKTPFAERNPAERSSEFRLRRDCQSRNSYLAVVALAAARVRLRGANG